MEKPSDEFRLGAQPTSIAQRKEQLKRWELSETYRESEELKREAPRIAFQRGCIFLATCASGDYDEIRRQLDSGVDINTANVDGLTALHQACIDNNLDLVTFLLECGANLNVQDNEGWTPLHAAAHCGYLELTKFLIDRGASLTAVTSDGELVIDLADTDEMTRFLRTEMERHGVAADDCRDIEQKTMLADAQQWLAQRNTEWLTLRDYKTGATALHVAAAKGYQDVLEVLIQLVQISTSPAACLAVRDKDNWTPLHAAAHWNHEDACNALIAAGASLRAVDAFGQTPVEVANTEIRTKLLQKRESSLSNDHEMDDAPGGSSARRRSSNGSRLRSILVTRDANGNVEVRVDANGDVLPNCVDANQNAIALDNAVVPAPADLSVRTDPVVSVQPAAVQPPTAPTPMEVLESDVQKPPETDNKVPAFDRNSTLSDSLASNDQQRSSWLTEQRRQRRQRLLELYGIADELEKEKQHEQPDTNITDSKPVVPTVTPATTPAPTPAPASTPAAAPASAPAPSADSGSSMTAKVPVPAVVAVAPAPTLQTVTLSVDPVVPPQPATPSQVIIAPNISRPSEERRAPAQTQPNNASTSSNLRRVLPIPAPAPARAPTPAPPLISMADLVDDDAASGDERRPSGPSVLAPSAQESTETQRKARAKRARETRRSTQGVTQEDKDEALRTIEQANQNRLSAAVNQAAAADAKTEAESANPSQENGIVLRRRDLKPQESLAAQSQLGVQHRQAWLRGVQTFDTGAPSPTKDNASLSARTQPSLLPSPSPSPSASMTGVDGILDKDKLNGDRNSRERVISITAKPSPTANNTPVTHTTASLIRSSSVQRHSPAATPATTLPTARVEPAPALPNSRPPSTIPTVATASASVIVVPQSSLSSSRTRQRDRRTPISFATGAKQDAPNAPPNGIASNEPASAISTTLSTSQLPQANNRYSNRVQFTPMSNTLAGQSTTQNSAVLTTVTVTPGRPATTLTTNRVSSGPMSRTSSIEVPVVGGTGQTQVDYRKLYDQECSENARLRREVEDLQRQVSDLRAMMQHQQTPVDSASTDGVIDRRERRALERRMAECEEELKQIAKLKADNVKIKQENEALIRVISKLTK